MDEVYETIVKRYLVNYYNEVAELMHSDLPDGTREEAMQVIDDRYTTAILNDLGVVIIHP